MCGYVCVYICVSTHIHTDLFSADLFLSLLSCCLCPHCQQYNHCLETVCFLFFARLKKIQLSRSCFLFVLFFFSILPLLHKRGEASRVWGSSVCWLPLRRFRFRRHFLDVELRPMRKSPSNASRLSEELLRKSHRSAARRTQRRIIQRFLFFLNWNPLRRKPLPRVRDGFYWYGGEKSKAGDSESFPVAEKDIRSIKMGHGCRQIAK